MAGKSDKEREAIARSKNQYLVYKRSYRPSEKRYGENLSFYRGFNTYAEAYACVMSNPAKYVL